MKEWCQFRLGRETRREFSKMKHTKAITKMGGPAPAQFESLLQLVGLIASLLSLFTNITDFLGSKE